MRQCFIIVIGFALLGTLAGCNRSKEPADSDPDLPEWLAEGDDADASDRSEDSGFFGDDDAGHDRFSNSDSPARSDRTVDADRLGRLELHLREGDRFPLRKVIDVQLLQSSLNAEPDVSRRLLDIMMMITVGEKSGDRTRLKVSYDHIQYVRNLAGEHLEYDSRQPPQEIPVAVRIYHDMVRDGFSFWVDDKNRIVQSDDFQAFIGRCLQNVPTEHRQQVMMELESTGENGITDFVDNSIGLLPYGYHKAGDAWERTRNIVRPIPIVVKDTYTLKNLNAESALIGIEGVIGAATPVQQASGSGEIQVAVTGGSSTGSCIVYRESGLPQKSRVETVVDMLVTAGPAQFAQQQKTVTTIESYPESRPSRSQVQTAEHEFDEDVAPARSRTTTGKRMRRLK